MIFKSFNRKAALTSLFALSAFLPMSACDLANNFTKMDRSTNSELQDYRDALAPREIPGADASTNSNGIPDVEAYVADGSKSMKSAPLVSLSINQSIPLREALFELAKQADFDIELDPRISGSIIFTARNRPLDEVIDRICEVSGLRYKISENTIRIEIDSPYSKTYKIDFLNFVRKNESTMDTDVSISSSGDAKSGGGSKFSIDSKSDGDFWAELDLNLKQILASNASPSYLKTDEDPTISLTSGNPVNPPVPPIDGAALSETAPQAGTEDYVSSPVSIPTAPSSSTLVPSSAPSATAVAPTTTTTTTTTSAPTTATAPAVDPAAAPQSLTSKPVAPAQAPVLKVESLPTSFSGGNAKGANSVEFTPAFSINKQAGIVSVYANERLQKQVANYLADLRRAATSQVLIEAKVLEVTLSDEFSAGINWSLIDKGDVTLASTFAAPGLDPASTSSFTFGLAGDDLSSFVSALSRFGTVHALASPRLSVLNNQSAVLNVARNQVYFEIDVTTTPSSTTGGQPTTTYDTTAKTVPEGVMINVLPSIDLERRTISMQVRPTITKIEDFVDDPVIGLNGGTVPSRIPVMNVQEADSVLNMKDKQMMVMGGLLQDSTKSTQEGLPVAGEVPVLGALFRNQGDKVSKKELVVFIKATILDNAGDSIHQTDKDLYRVFSQDRRPDKL
jgi:MSHA biogenesis protein MshL